MGLKVGTGWPGSGTFPGKREKSKEGEVQLVYWMRERVSGSGLGCMGQGPYWKVGNQGGRSTQIGYGIKRE